MTNEKKKPVQTGRVPPPAKKNSKKKVITIIVIVILLLLALLFVLYKCGYLGGDTDSPTNNAIGAGVKEGSIGEITAESGEAGSNGKTDMTVQINGYPVFTDGQSEGSLNIVNPEENMLYMQVEITLSDTGEMIYESGAIPPGHYIDNDKLSKVLNKGEYAASAHVTLFDPDNPDTDYNAANFNLIITIEN